MDPETIRKGVPSSVKLRVLYVRKFRGDWVTREEGATKVDWRSVFGGV